MSTATPAIPGYCVDAQCLCHQSPYAELFALAVSPTADGLPIGCCTRCGRRGPKPATFVLPPMSVSNAEMEARIERTRREHAATLQDFHRVWYECGHTWVWTNFLGVGMMKNPMDLWAYQELLTAQRPRTIIETGTYAGGSALWFSVLMDALGIEDGRVLTIDLDDHRKCQHDRITFIGGDSTDPSLAAAVLAEVQHPLLISLDADHSRDHVLKELNLYAPAVNPGEYLVVEDTNVSWDDERGARGAVEDYLTAHQGEFRQDILREHNLLSMHPGGWLQRIAECAHV